MSTVGTPQAARVRYLIDAARSTFIVRAFATGMLSAFAHSPTIAIPDFQGEVQWNSSALEDASLRFVVRAPSLTVTDDISDKDRQEIERKMYQKSWRQMVSRRSFTNAPEFHRSRRSARDHMRLC